MESKEVKDDVQQEEYLQQRANAFKKDIADSDVTLIGDKSTICQVV